MANFTENLTHLVAKIEGTSGTPEALASADFDVRLSDISISYEIQIENDAMKLATGDHTTHEAISGARNCTFTFKCPMQWGGAVATAPKWVKFLKGSGCVETAYTTTGKSWAPEKSADATTMTIWGYKLTRGGAAPTATAFKASGCAGKVTSMGFEKVGGEWWCTFEFKGQLNTIEAVANGSLLVLTSPDTTIAERALSNTFTIGGVAGSISKFNFTDGNVVEGQTDQSTATGYTAFNIVSRDPRLTVDPYMQLVGTDDVFTQITGHTVAAISLTSAASTPHFTFSVPRAQLISAPVGAREGSTIYEKSFKCLGNTAGSTAVEKERSWELLQGAKA